MGKVFISTSYKGGVGKSTVAVNLSVGLAARGFTSLIIDLDSCVRCVDLLLGCENDILFSFQDYILERVSFDKIVTSISVHLPSKTCKVDMIAAPLTIDEKACDEEKFSRFINTVREKYDYVIFDCPPGEFFFLKTLCRRCDSALVVSDHTATSLRAAEKSADYLFSNGLADTKLIINGFTPQGIAEGINPGIIDVIETVKVRLLGIIEYDSAIKKGQEQGLTVYQLKERTPKQNFEDIISRILGENTVLRRKYGGIRTTKLHYSSKKYSNRKKGGV